MTLEPSIGSGNVLIKLLGTKFNIYKKNVKKIKKKNQGSLGKWKWIMDFEEEHVSNLWWVPSHPTKAIIIQ